READPHPEERGTRVSKDAGRVVAWEERSRASWFARRCAASSGDGAEPVIGPRFARTRWRLLTMRGRKNQRGARFARIRCNVRRCMLSRRAVSETLRL